MAPRATRRFHFLGWFLLLGTLLTAVPVRVQAAADLANDWPAERWFIVRMFDEKAGWLHSQRTIDEEGNLVSSETFKLSMSRMGQEIAIEMRSRFVETPAGEPVEIGSYTNLGAMPTETVYRFSSDSKKVAVITKQSEGRERTRQINRPVGKWLTPAQVSQFVEKRLEAGAESIAYASLDASSGLQVILVRSTVKERTTVEALGKTVPAILWESTNSVMPDVVMQSYVDLKGQDIRSTVNIGGITMEIIASEREVALSPFKAPEMMVSTMVSPIGDLHEPRTSKQATYLLRLTSEDDRVPMPDLVTAAGQRAHRLEPRTVRVTIDLDNPVTLNASDRDQWFDPRTMGSSAMIDLDDELLQQTMERALESLPSDASDASKAEALRRFVYRYINSKNLGVGFASASETCRTREGDCSEHATLLTALLRLAGIPSRTVSGLVYVDQFMDAERVFGFHMWSQALLPMPDAPDGTKRWAWVDLDAALSPVHPTDAARIAVTASTLADDDTINSMVDIAVLMGQLTIEIETPTPTPTP